MKDTNFIICDYIKRKWIDPWKPSSIRDFAVEHDIDEKTARRIRDIHLAPYSISLKTLEKICASRNLLLKDFFKLIDR